MERVGTSFRFFRGCVVHDPRRQLTKMRHVSLRTVLCLLPCLRGFAWQDKGVVQPVGRDWALLYVNVSARFDCSQRTAHSFQDVPLSEVAHMTANIAFIRRPGTSHRRASSLCGNPATLVYHSRHRENAFDCTQVEGEGRFRLSSHLHSKI